MDVKELAIPLEKQRSALHAIGVGIFIGMYTVLVLAMVVFGFFLVQAITVGDSDILFFAIVSTYFSFIIALPGLLVLVLTGGVLGGFLLQKKRSLFFTCFWFPLVLLAVATPVIIWAFESFRFVIP